MGRVFALRLNSARFLVLLDLDHPVQVTRLFTTLADGQRKAVFDFYFREAPDSAWLPVGQVQWDALPASPAGEPTLELSLIPEREESLLLRLKERSTGISRSYGVRFPAFRRPPPPARADAADRTAAVAAVPVRAGAAGHAVRPVPLAPAAPRRRAFRWKAAALAAAAAALAGAAFALFRFTPLGSPAGEGGAAQWRAPAAVQAPAPQPARPEPERPGPPAERPAPQPARPEPERPGPQEVLSHRVQWGDTLWRITERYYGNPNLYSLLAGENALADPDLLISGTELRLPSLIDDQERKQ